MRFCRKKKKYLQHGFIFYPSYLAPNAALVLRGQLLLELNLCVMDFHREFDMVLCDNPNFKF